MTHQISAARHLVHFDSPPLPRVILSDWSLKTLMKCPHISMFANFGIMGTYGKV